MPITAAIAVPHPPLIFPEIGKGEQKVIQKTIDAYEKAVSMVAATKPETVVVISPHAEMFHDWIEISPDHNSSGSFARYGVPQLGVDAFYDVDLVHTLEELAAKHGIAAGPSGQANNVLDHGTMIPLVFLNNYLSDYKVVRIGISGLPFETHYNMGRLIAKAAGDKRVAVIASGDLSHRLTKDGPYGYLPEGPQLDKIITDALDKGDWDTLINIDRDVAQKGAECGLRAFIMMGGALHGKEVTPRLLSYEGPFGVGYAVATYEINGKKTGESASEKTANPYVALARHSLATYLETGKPAATPNNLPTELADRQAGAFVTLYQRGQLRGCIGTIAATAGSLAEEIMQNTVSAGTEDPRFRTVQADEVAELTFSVDVLGDAEKIGSIGELDPEKYGVIVSRGYQRGLLLPNLDGVDTAEKQVEIALQKAGIPANAPYTLERFEVVRHSE